MRIKYFVTFLRVKNVPQKWLKSWIPFDEKLSLTNQRSKFFHVIKTRFFRIPAMTAENVVNDTKTRVVIA